MKFVEDFKNKMLTLLAIIAIRCLCVEGKLFGDHICQTEITEPQEVVQWELKAKTVRTYKWCMSVPPRCSVYSHQVFNDTKVSVINVTKSIDACCEGFHEQNSYCISMCQDCKNGLCLKGTCICQSGWDGLNCDSRVPNSHEESTYATTIQFSSTIIPETHSPTKDLNDNDSTTIIFTTQQGPTSTGTRLNTFAERPNTSPTSTTNIYELLPTLLQNSSEATILPFSKKEMINPVTEEKVEVTTIPNFAQISKESISSDYVIEETKSKESEEDEFTGLYSTNSIYLDTTVTQQTSASSPISFSKSQEESTTSHSPRLYSNFSSNVTTFVTSPKYPDLLKNNPADNSTNSEMENPDSELDMDYRELGGQSFEEKSMESPNVHQSGVDKNIIYLNVPKTTSRYNGFRKNLENGIQRNSTQNILEATASVLDKTSILKDEKDNNILKKAIKETSEDFTEERYQKRSSNQNFSQNTLLSKTDSDNNNLIYSVCAATATTVLILIIVIVALTLRNAKKKVDKNKVKKDVATVAVYTTSIFHSPLPDPPTFENPTYLLAGGHDTWDDKQANGEEMIEVQEFNVVYQKPLKNPKLDSKQYLYDHPPSTGSYRASSEVDTLSQYNLSHKSLSGIILEPVYDEIPSRDNSVEASDEVFHRNSIVHTPRNSLSFIDNNSLYVNTLGRTKF